METEEFIDVRTRLKFLVADYGKDDVMKILDSICEDKPPEEKPKEEKELKAEQPKDKRRYKTKESKSKVGKAIKYPKELEKFVKDNINDMTNQKLVKAINAEFNLNISLPKFMNYKLFYKIKRTESAHKPLNQGLRGPYKKKESDTVAKPIKEKPVVPEKIVGEIKPVDTTITIDTPVCTFCFKPKEDPNKDICDRCQENQEEIKLDQR